MFAMLRVQCFLLLLFCLVLLLCGGPGLIVSGCCLPEFLLELSEVLLGFRGFLFDLSMPQRHFFQELLWPHHKP